MTSHQKPKIAEQQKLLLLSALTGILSGLAAVLLTFLISLVKNLLNGSFSSLPYNWQYLLFPGAGMLISLLMLKYLVKDNIGHGVTKALLAISRNESRIKGHNVWSSILTSSITIGFGGSVGAEAPIVYTGSAIGSNVGRLFKLPHKSITILLGCGAAGAIAGIFKAPLAGVLFVMEILLFNISMSSMLPLLVSTLSAAGIAYVFSGQEPVFHCDLVEFSVVNIPYYLILGVVCGFASLYFTGVTLSLEDKMARISNGYLRWIIASVSLGCLIFIFPPLYGEGYDSLHCLLTTGNEIEIESHSVLSFLSAFKWGAPVFFLLVFFFKVIAMTMTNAGGGVGGTFGPTLFEGAVLGFVVVKSLELVGIAVPEQNFVLVGMASLMAAVMQAPMTAIFLIAEISGGYELMLPLVIAATTSFGVSRIFEKYSIYTKRIAQSGDLLTHDNDQAVLTLLQTRDLVRDKYPKVSLQTPLREVVKIISDDTAAILVVVDRSGRFQGIVDVGNVRRFLFDVKNYDSLYVYNIMESSPAIIRIDERVESVMTKFDSTGAWRLPVLDSSDKYLGCISRSRILMAYRNELREISLQD